jgi:hypothetical protein
LPEPIRRLWSAAFSRARADAFGLRRGAGKTHRVVIRPLIAVRGVISRASARLRAVPTL